MKNTVALFLLRVCRLYMRYFPLTAGKLWLYQDVIGRYLLWRPHSAIVRMRAGPRVEIQLPDQIQERLYFFGEWEPDISRYIASVLQEGDLVIDVGANIGYFTLLAASIVGTKGEVCAVEASPRNYAALSRNVRRSGFSNITTYNKAAAAAPGKARIFLGPDSNLGATTTVLAVAERKGQSFESEVEADTLSSIVGEQRLLGARLIKVDIEGAEYSMIAGIAALLPRCSPRTEWLMEISPEAMEEQGQSVESLLGMLREAGYDIYTIRNDYRDETYLDAPAEVALQELDGVPKRTVDILARRARN